MESPFAIDGYEYIEAHLSADNEFTPLQEKCLRGWVNNHQSVLNQGLSLADFAE